MSKTKFTEEKLTADKIHEMYLNYVARGGNPNVFCDVVLSVSGMSKSTSCLSKLDKSKVTVISFPFYNRKDGYTILANLKSKIRNLSNDGSNEVSTAFWEYILKLVEEANEKIKEESELLVANRKTLIDDVAKANLHTYCERNRCKSKYRTLEKLIARYSPTDAEILSAKIVVDFVGLKEEQKKELSEEELKCVEDSEARIAEKKRKETLHTMCEPFLNHIFKLWPEEDENGNIVQKTKITQNTINSYRSSITSMDRTHAIRFGSGLNEINEFLRIADLIIDHEDLADRFLLGFICLYRDNGMLDLFPYDLFDYSRSQLEDIADPNNATNYRFSVLAYELLGSN